MTSPASTSDGSPSGGDTNLANGLPPEAVLAWLRDYESRNVTYLDPDGSWPIVWERARGMQVWDAAGKRYLDFTAAFGVAAAGHANPRVVRAGQRQLARLPHAMGDVHPHALKARLARELSRLTFERWQASVTACSDPSAAAARARGKTIFCNSGFEAVEAALKTAVLATGRPGVIAFKHAYHGLGYGALNVTHRPHFRAPFEPQLRAFAEFVDFPTDTRALGTMQHDLARLGQRGDIGAVIVEPVQGRGGIQVPPTEFLPVLRSFCDARGALLLLDEVYTGFGRTGRWFACEHSPIRPDIVCLGKALTGGFPLSACVGRAEVMDAAWPPSTGEAIHTSTFLGNPVGCAMALAQIAELEREALPERSAQQGAYLLGRLRELASRRAGIRAVRGLGLMTGVELAPDGKRPPGDVCVAVVKRLLRAGFLALPEGAEGQVLGLTPPLVVTRRQIDRFCRALEEALFAEDM